MKGPKKDKENAERLDRHFAGSYFIDWNGQNKGKLQGKSVQELYACRVEVTVRVRASGREAG